MYGAFVTVAAATVRLSVALTDWGVASESATFKATENVPAAVGVPAIELPLTAKPAGSPVAVQVYGAVPPEAASGWTYATPTVPGPRLAVVVERDAGGTDTTWL